jgi:heme A synthase
VVHWVHRWLGVTLLGFFIQLAAASRRTALGGATALAATLATLQVALGVAAVLLRLDPPIRAIHAAVGYALWGTLVWVSARAGSWPTLVAGAPATREPALEAVHASWRPAPRGGRAKP